MATSTTTLFKVHHVGDIRRLRVANTNDHRTAPKVADLMAALTTTYEPVSIGLPVFWQDEEGDFITIKTDADLEEAVRTAAGQLVRLMVNADATNEAESAAADGRVCHQSPTEFVETTLSAAVAGVESVELAAERGAELAAKVFEPHWKAMMEVTNGKAFHEVRKMVKASIEHARSELKSQVQAARAHTKATVDQAQASLQAFDATVKTCREKVKGIVGAWKAEKQAEKKAKQAGKKTKQAAKQKGANAAACTAVEPPDSFIDEHDALMILAAMQPGSAVECPGCSLIIEKVDGDDSMMCGCEGKPAGGTMEKALAGGGCGVEFSFATGIPIGQGKPGAPANARQWKFYPPEPEPEPESEPKLEPELAEADTEPTTPVVRAWYGRPDHPHFEDGDGGIDLTSVAAGFVQDGVLTLPASNKIGGDPAIGVRKVLAVEYLDRAGDIQTATAWEGDAVQVEVFIPTAVETPAESDWEYELAVLTTMGFKNRELLSALLTEHKGSVQHVVASIL